MVVIEIDGRELEARDGETVLEVLKQNGINIPTLCYHPALKPSGACKLCAVDFSAINAAVTKMSFSSVHQRGFRRLSAMNSHATSSASSGFWNSLSRTVRIRFSVAWRPLVTRCIGWPRSRANTAI